MDDLGRHPATGEREHEGDRHELGHVAERGVLHLGDGLHRAHHDADEEGTDEGRTGDEQRERERFAEESFEVVGRHRYDW